jgi:hypothetical protein
MTSKVVYAIPSYGRSSTIADQTLACLARGNVPLSDIYVFIVQEEEEAYRRAIPRHQIQIGLKGLIKQRMFIQGFFDKDTYIVFCDDDLKLIYRPLNEKTSEEILDIPSLISKMIMRMTAEDVSICGVYPCCNLKFALGNPEITTDFRYLVGAMYMIKNLRLPEVQLESSDESHEDKIRTIKYYQKEKKCLRYNWVLIKTKYFAKGGLDSPNRLKQHAIDAEALCLRFPLHLRLQKTRKMTDAKFRRLKN